MVGMGQVFSRWPSPVPAARVAGDDGAGDLPAWMRTAPAPRWPGLRFDLGACVLVLGPAALACLAGCLAAMRPGVLASIVGAFAIAAALAASYRATRLGRVATAGEASAKAIFERAGVSMWREDWTAAGEAVMALRRAGIQDIEGHFASRPDELRAIKARVVIKDVNSFTIEETGAPSRDAYLGPLDRLLPDTDQTFVQWLVAFGRGDRFFRSEAHVTTADGAEIDTLFTAMLPSDLAGFADIVVTSLDVTAFKQAQTRLAEAETELERRSRATTVGALSASIAHEVNSPLTAVIANVQAALRWLKRPEPNLVEAVAALDDAICEASRARDVVARTRSFFGDSVHTPEPVDLVEAARDANLFVEREIRAHGATVHLAAERDVPPVLADLVQVQQVFVNLFVNAAQAMADNSGRRDITVTIRAQQRLVAVDVSDTGPGIAPERRARIFDPFHSTKPGGMGLGLAICRNCIDANGGDLWVDAAPGGGAAFHFTLPVVA